MNSKQRKAARRARLRTTDPGGDRRQRIRNELARTEADLAVARWLRAETIAKRDATSENLLAALEELVSRDDAPDGELAEHYFDLAEALARLGRYDDAIDAMQHALDAGWNGRPDGRCDIARFHLQAGRPDEAEALLTVVKADTPDDAWLYNSAGFDWAEIGNDPARGLAWLTDGIELALRTGDPGGIVAQMSDERRHCLAALGRDLDELETRVDRFLDDWIPHPFAATVSGTDAADGRRTATG